MELLIWLVIFIFGVISGLFLGRVSIRKNSIFGVYYLDSEEHNIIMRMDENQIVEGKKLIVLRKQNSR